MPRRARNNFGTINKETLLSSGMRPGFKYELCTWNQDYEINEIGMLGNVVIDIRGQAHSLEENSVIKVTKI